MKRIRHSFGRWLLRDAKPAPIVVKFETKDTAAAILQAIAKHRRRDI